MMRLLTPLVLGLCLVACSPSPPTAPSTSTTPMATAPSSVTFQPGESFSVTPSLVDFGTQMVNTTSAPRAITVTNAGRTPQPVNGRIDGPPGHWQNYAYTTNCPSTIAVGASCTFNITFTPTATGDRAAVLVVDGSNDEEGFVNLGGAGTN